MFEKNRQTAASWLRRFESDIPTALHLESSKSNKKESKSELSKSFFTAFTKISQTPKDNIPWFTIFRKISWLLHNYHFEKL